MDAVQAPIVPIIGDIIRQVPGTISLGQGVVHYGPPPAALDAVRGALGAPSTHEYQDGAGLRALVDRLALKLRAENGIDVARGVRIMVTAGANMAFMHAVLAITAPGDEIILNVPFYFNHEMAIQMAGCVPVRVATDDRYQPSAPTTRAAPSSARRRSATSTRCAAIAGSITSPTRSTSTSPTDRRGTCRREHFPPLRDTRSRCTRSRRPTASPAGASAI
jgi:aspartate/methionine/tyrosine aminotransferase